ncbi:DUF3488 domain-containing protein [Gordonia zhaorongruii]|uniref:DUF3488 domain-containing protein n=1 Tax=Gordonia zhaorongruii TaxID=2597659 RepID=UPI001045DF3E|nr:hypothetical protein [Gordonia zhaorongruii]
MFQARRITAFAVALIVAQLIVRTWLVARGHFYWDDLILISRASSHPILSWEFLGHSHDGHFMPAAFGVAGLSTLIAPVQWWLPAITLVVLQAVASIAVWRMIKIIAPGGRGGALAALAFYLFVPMTLTAFVWWAAGLNTLPLQAAMAYIVGSAVRLVRDRAEGKERSRLIVCSVIAFVVALAFFEKSLMILPVAFVAALLAVRASAKHSADPGDYRTSALSVTFLRARSLWAALGVLFAAWSVLFLSTTTATDGEHSVSQTARLVWRSVNNAIVPSFAGGPWDWERWIPSPPMGFAPIWMIGIGWLVLAGLVIATMRAKRGIGIIWFCAGLYAVGAQIPVMWTRSSENTALELAQTLRYLPDTALVFTIAFALIVASQSSSGSHSATAEPDRRPAIVGTVGAVVLAVSAMIATTTFAESWRSDGTAEYLSNAKQSLRENSDRVMFDQEVPLEVLLPVAYPNNLISHVFGRLSERPDFGTHTDRLVVLDPNGQAVPGGVTRARTISESSGSCKRPGIRGPERLDLDGPLIDVQWTIQLSYCADRDGEIELRLDGGEPLRVPVKSGLQFLYAQLHGAGDALQIRPVTPGLRLHTGEGRVGRPVMAGLAP